ncbi:MAG: hypothetical protein ACI9HK_005317 [Pirellulaceae bacterium]|jgi:hypothetical protein
MHYSRLISIVVLLVSSFNLAIQATAPLLAAEFDEVVAPFVNAHCKKCHGKLKPKGGLSLVELKTDFSDETVIDTWQLVLEQLELGAMPPEKVAQPQTLQVKQVTSWITEQLRRVQQIPAVEHKLRSPEFGNYVNHRRLFDGSEKGPSSSPPRLWRLSPYVYDRFVDGVGGDLRRQTAIHQPFPLDAGKGLLADFAAQQFAGAATLELLQMNCQTIAEFQTTGVQHRDHEGKLRRLKRTPREFEGLIQSEKPVTSEQIETAIRYEFQLLLQRPPTANELQELVQFCRTASEIGGNARGLQTTLKAILMKPESVYRMEIGLGPLDELGRRRLSEYELAFAIARALTDKGPDDIQVRFPLPGSADRKAIDEVPTRSVLALAQAGVLAEPENIRRLVVQILNDNNMSTANYRMFTEDHRIGNTRVLRFFREFFGYHHAPKVFKDEKRIGFGDRYLTERMVDDADQLVMHIFDQDKEVLRRLLTTDEYFVAYLGSLDNIQKDLHYIKTNKNDGNFRFNSEYVKRAEDAGRHPIPIEGPSSRSYVDFYNLDHETWDYPTQQPFRLPAKQRAGILTHPAWLIAWSGNFDNDPIRRGKWIREHLLADTIPDVPLNVNAVVPEEPHKSLRDRLQVTREEYCWKCHEKMDPLGLPFEQYDDFGRYRDREMVGELLSIFPERHTKAKTLPINTNGAINRSGDASLDGEVDNVAELVGKLADSERVRQSFVRHAFRYWMGRNETLDDSPTLMAADDAYVKGGGSMKALIASLLSSDSFLYRKKK